MKGDPVARLTIGIGQDLVERAEWPEQSMVLL
jgi:hypothetical protein